MNIYEMLEAVKNLPEGDYVEAGVYKGFMAAKIAARMYASANLWLLDTFTGHEEPCEFDDAVRHPKGRYADTSVDEVYTKLSYVLRGYAAAIPGRVQDTLPKLKDKKFRFVHIDLDHYLPTKTACEFFKSRMVPGGIIRFDDYGFAECPGATKAVDEVFGRDNILSEDYRWHNSC